MNNETGGTKTDSLPPWPSEPPPDSDVPSVGDVDVDMDMDLTALNEIRDAANGVLDHLDDEEPPGDRTSGLVLTVDPRVGILEGHVATLERQRNMDSETIARLTTDTARLDDITRAEKALRDSSLVQIRRLSALERELDGTKTALAAASHERDELRARARELEADLGALREAVTIAEAGARAAAAALSTVTRALEVAAESVRG